MYRSNIVGNKLGSGCWSSYCNKKNANTQNYSCNNLSGQVIASSVLLRTSVNYKPNLKIKAK